MKAFYNSKKFLKFVFFILADLLLIALSVILAFIVRFEGSIPQRYYNNVLSIILFASFVTVFVFYSFKLYHFTWRYVGTQELINLVKGVSLSFLLLTGLFFILKDYVIFSGFPRSTLFISYFFIFILCGGLRFVKRLYSQIFPASSFRGKIPTLIVGAGDAGELLLRNILSSETAPFRVIGFIDDAPLRQGILIHGVKVLGKISDIPDIVRKNDIKTIIIAMPSVDSDVIQKVVRQGRDSGIKHIKIIPPIDEVFAGNVTIAQLRDFKEEEILEREIVEANQELISSFIGGKDVLVTGAAGSIGSELCRQIIKFNPKSITLLDQDETRLFEVFENLKKREKGVKKLSVVADITDELKIDRLFEKLKPTLVFHAAAYKHVPLMELDPYEAVRNNVFGTKTLADAALKYKCEKFVFISTDKAVDPTSVMGATKRIGEMICQAYNQRGSTKFISVRFGNVLDSRGNVITIFRERIKNRQPIEVTHPDMERYFMVTSEACSLVLHASSVGKGGEVFILDMGNPIKIIDLAQKVIKLVGLEPDKDIPIVYTKPRLGEKFSEKLFALREKVLGSIGERIFKVEPPSVSLNDLLKELNILQKELQEGDERSIREIMKKILPNYVPQQQ